MEKTKKILIVDDEELVIKALTEKLLSEGFAIDSAVDGEEALIKIKQIKPDLILLDIIMPKLDGISVLKKLKASSETQHIPVIILTNLYDDERVAEVLKTGGTDYLVKVEHTLADIIKRVKEKLQ
jgi:PleD family two-component response regulator